MQNPFTTTFSKIPDNSYIPTEQSREIISNFDYEDPSESLYKITGVRGSGKTVLLAKIEEEFLSAERVRAGWLVYRISPNRDMLQQLYTMLINDGFGKSANKIKSVSLSATVLGSGGGIGIGTEDASTVSDIGVAIDDMLAQADKKKKRILIGIDEVSKTPEMIVFAAEFGKWLRAGYHVYVVCTGLYENIEQLSNVSNLTFFRRATTIKTEPLNLIRMTEMYQKRLTINKEEALTLARITKGYAYAFQELGVIYFKKSKQENLDDILQSLKTELYSYAYEKIWEELTPGDRELVCCMLETDEVKREDVMKQMSKPANYSVYRDRLIKRGIITSRQAYISLALPYFGEYVKEYHGEV